ncbi:SPOR domain-containing protein [Neisseria sp. 23W00296]|uniref:SPOR domain-containing protein n=2 Tax=unclassified Neisseria TaxID=2623750 RepID=UPI0037564418
MNFMKTEKPYGKGLTGFIIGLLLATLIIGGVVYVLETGRKRDFKDPVVEKELPPPEILTPKKPAEPVPPPQPLPASEPQSISASEPKEIPASEPKAQDDTEPSDIIGIPDALPPHKTDKPKPERKKTDKPQAKPTPEQILNGKAGKNQAKTDREAERKKAQDALNGHAGKSEAQSGGSGKGRIIVQAGSYGSRDKAEVQRAKLAMAGVDAHVAEATVQGKTMYRVQTAPLTADAAANTRQTLQQKGIDSFARPAR